MKRCLTVIRVPQFSVFNGFYVDLFNDQGESSFSATLHHHCACQLICEVTSAITDEPISNG